LSSGTHVGEGLGRVVGGGSICGLMCIWPGKILSIKMFKFCAQGPFYQVGFQSSWVSRTGCASGPLLENGYHHFVEQCHPRALVYVGTGIVSAPGKSLLKEDLSYPHVARLPPLPPPFPNRTVCFLLGVTSYKAHHQTH